MHFFKNCQPIYNFCAKVILSAKLFISERYFPDKS